MLNMINQSEKCMLKFLPLKKTKAGMLLMFLSLSRSVIVMMEVQTL